MQLLRKLGCVDPTQHSDAHLPVGCLAACMVAAGIKPDDEPLLKSLVTAYRSYALKNVIVCLPCVPRTYRQACDFLHLLTYVSLVHRHRCRHWTYETFLCLEIGSECFGFCCFEQL